MEDEIIFIIELIKLKINLEKVKELDFLKKFIKKMFIVIILKKYLMLNIFYFINI